MQRLGHSFLTIVRPVEVLRELLLSDPYHCFHLKPHSKRVVTLLRERPKSKNLSWSPDGSRIAYDRSTQGNADVWVRSIGVGFAYRLTTHPALDSDPTW